MIAHLQGLVLSAIFNPVFLGFLIAVYVLGWALGKFMPWQSIVRPMIIVFAVGLALKLFVFQWGYDLYFIMGFPFIAGLWRSSARRERL